MQKTYNLKLNSFLQFCISIKRIEKRNVGEQDFLQVFLPFHNVPKLLLIFLFWSLGGIVAVAQNAIVIENAKAGSPPSQWEISGAGDLSIQGFATDISYNKGETARFKIKTNARAYKIDIYRLGYYQGNGARLQGTATVTAPLPQSQPSCLTNSSTGLLDCGNWNESAIWAIPSTAVSGIFIAKLTRTDTGGSSHIVFIVRDDAGNSDLFFQTSDATWQAYNVYGDNNNGKSLYTGSGGKAVKVSYNRPFLTRNGGGGGGPSEDWLFNAEYPMLRWIEANGYDVSYTTNVDSDRRGDLIKNHKVFLSVGHDEYWSGAHRAKVVEARNAGTHLAFFSGNEVYWKTRWENSIDGNGVPYRTLVCYKEGSSGENVCNSKCDPSPEWTGLWRNGCEYQTGDVTIDGCQPENALTGQISWELSDASLQVPSEYKDLRFWRNTNVANLNNGQSASFTYGTIGYEWNSEQDQYKSYYPSGRILLSRTVVNGNVHNISLYKHSSGALVFGAGTVQWSWGLDRNHDRGNAAPSLDMQQATLNLFADMGAQPGSIQPGLVKTTASTDTQGPVTVISSPSENQNLTAGAEIVISGTATDDEVLVGVEVSTDGGITWGKATGTANWSYSWNPFINGPVTILSRGFDDSGNIGTPASRNITIGEQGEISCPCSVFQPSETPNGSIQNDGQAIQLGMKFRATTNGFITGARFYKQNGDTGVHIGQLYNTNGNLLAEATFINETATGWQQVLFSSPVAVMANTTYIISYHSSGGYYSVDDRGFDQARISNPLKGLANGEDGANGLYSYSQAPVFPTSNFLSSNYWVDVIFNNEPGSNNSPPFVEIISPTNGITFSVPASVEISVTASDPDGEVTKVEFYHGENLLGEDTDEQNGWSYLWEGAPAGSYALKVVATDNQGAKTTSAAINITISDPENAAPLISISNPVNNSTFTAPANILITASASDTDGEIVKVEFFNGNTRLGEDLNLSDGLSYMWSAVPSGTYVLTAVATDDKGAVSTSSAVSFSVNPDPGSTVCPCSVFLSSEGPSGSLQNDGNALQLGMKFRSTINGFVTGARFYKQNGDTGTHVAQLYTNTGNLLAEATFLNETASGWQEVSFDSPVDIVANSTYVISYHSSQGYYSVDDRGFDEPRSNDPLVGLADGEDGDNGLYRYSQTPIFPTSNYLSSNYWIDVIFENETLPANNAPTVAIISPEDAGNFTAPANITISVSASDADGEVLKVEFYNGIAKLGEDLNGADGWSFPWNSVTEGSYVLTAVATDNKGASTTSAEIAISVSDPVNTAPTVAITSPEDAANFTAPANITISVSASDADGEVLKVEFYNGTSKLGEDLNGADGWSLLWNSVTAGSYALTAVATDDNGASTTSSEIAISVSDPVNTAPTIAISSPEDAANFTAPADITISVSASDADGEVLKVEFYNETSKLGEDLNGADGWTFVWNSVAAGSYALTAVATDDNGASTTSSEIAISVSDPVNTAPTVAITAPQNGATFTAPANISISATASDNDGGVVKVEFFNGALKLGEDVTAADGWTFVWNAVAAGSYLLTAVATDDKGASTTSAGVSISVSDPVNTAPTVAITAPQNGATFTAPANISISAIASDSDGGVVRVEFFNGALKLGEDVTAADGWTFAWNAVATGFYTLTAVATDNLGASTTSAGVSLSVSTPLQLFPPTDLQAFWVSGSAVNLSWQDQNLNEDSFILERALKTDFTGKVDFINISPNTTSYEDRNLNSKKGGGNFYYRLKAIKGNLSSDYSNTALATALSSTTKQSLSNEAFTVEDEIIVYPNPAEGKTTIQFALQSNGYYSLNLYDTKGIYIANLDAGFTEAGAKKSFEFDGLKYASGWYIVQLQYDGISKSVRFLLIHK